MNQIEIEKTVSYMDKERLWSVSLRTPKPYGKFCPQTIYITAIFHKNLDKALKMAWREFYQSKDYQDANDRQEESRQTETVKVTV